MTTHTTWRYEMEGKTSVDVWERVYRLSALDNEENSGFIDLMGFSQSRFHLLHIA